MKMLRQKIITYEEEIPNNLNDFKKWEFSTGTTIGIDFKVFAREFRKFVKKNLPEGSELIDFCRGHYFISGFIKKGQKFVYFSISDVRYFPNSWAENILIRTAKDENDYTGGSNGYTTLERFKEDVSKLL